MNVSSMLLFCVVTFGLVDSAGRLYRVIMVCVGSVGITSVYVIRDWLENRHFSGYRPGGVSGDANYFALCASAGLLLGLNLLFGKRPRWEKITIFFSLGVTCVALILAASRGGFLGLGAGLLYLMFRLSKGLRPAALVLLVFVPILFAIPNTALQRVVNPGHSEELAVQARETTWKAGIKMFVAHPIAGIGLGTFKDRVLDYEDPDREPVQTLAHNTSIEIAAELGLLGFLAWLAIPACGF